VFSRRTQWTLSENAIAKAIEAHRRAGRSFIDLTETNPTRVGLPLPTELSACALSSSRMLEYSPISFGLPEAREAISRYFGGAVSADQICLAASTSEAYSWLFKLLCDPGDRVLVPTPGYPLFDYLAALEGVELALYRSRVWDDWSIDFEHLEGQVNERTKAIVVVAPNNPTGALLPSADFERLVELCQRYSLALISDEVFADYVINTNGRIRSLAGRTELLTFVLSGLSKVCLLPQLKVGWIAASGPATQLAEALGRLEIIADSFLSVSTPSQLMVSSVLDARQQIQASLKQRLSTNRDVLEGELRESPASVLRSDGGWSAVIRVPQVRTDAAWVLKLLEEAEVLVHPGYFFDFESDGYLVVSLLPAEDAFSSAVRRLGRTVSEGA
jgi:aspartate/methionine/tyrosine aminotransferase